MEKHNKLENEKEEVQVNDKDGYKKSPIIRPRIKRKFRLEGVEARKKNFNSKFGDGCDAADNKDGYNMQQEEQEEEESQWMIPGTPPKERPLRLRKNSTNSHFNKQQEEEQKEQHEVEEEEESQSLLAIEKKERRDALVFFGFNNKNIRK